MSSAFRHSTRSAFSNAERNDIVRRKLSAVAAASPHDEDTTFELICTRILQIRDDLAARTGQQTWARGSAARPYNDEQRLKAVGATVGAILSCEHRRTRAWVLEAIEEGINYVPWPH